MARIRLPERGHAASSPAEQAHVRRPTSDKPATPPAEGDAPSSPALPPDQPARDRIESVFDRNFLVEAGAGSGKTRSLARRMAAGIAAGVYDVSRMAAVTFTRKAAAELRGRFQEALEDRLRLNPPPDERGRLEDALRDIERLFTGTIHSFCARLLRERPVEARMAPGFTELDEVGDARLRKQAWREFLIAERARDSTDLEALKQVRLRPNDLDGALAAVCEHDDVEFPPGLAECPDQDQGWERLAAFWNKLSPLVPAAIDPAAKCRLLETSQTFARRLAFARAYRRTPATLAELMGEWCGSRLTMKWWGADGGRARDIVDRFVEQDAKPFIAAWRHYVYRVAMRVVASARAFYAAERQRQNVVNYVDLLVVTARLLRENAQVRAGLRAKYRWFFIDEFQDTDPIQAEIFLLLAAEDGTDRETLATSCGDGLDAWSVPLRPGALFVVGDPKQSIYRFRRADIDIYTRVKQRIQDCGGEVLPLTANWRSVPGVCAFANTVFRGLLPAVATRVSPAFEELAAMRAGQIGPCLARLVIPANVDKDGVVAHEAEQIARYVRAEVAAGRRKYGSFLILTRYKPRLRQYADALDALEIPVEVSGAGRFGGSDEVVALSLLLQALADPLDGPAIVGVLRGPLFGVSDPELFAFAQRGGQFELGAPLVGNDAPRVFALDDEGAVATDRDDLVTEYGPALDAILRLRAWRSLTRRLPLAAAVDRILEESGWLALAAAGSPGGARAGDLLQAIDVVRQVVQEGAGLVEAADALLEDEEITTTEVETLPLEPGRRDVVRLMNLHKAKGLEAEVVFLADPTHGFRIPTDVRIDREPRVPQGYLVIARDNANGGKTSLAEPEGWDAHCREEDQYRDAELQRLLYVAATRARDLLIVGQSASTSRTDPNQAWGELNRALAGTPVLEVLPQPTSPAPRSIDLSPGARERARSEREGRHETASIPSWRVTSVTGEHPVVRLRANRVRETVLGEPGRDEDDTSGSIVSQTETEHVDAGVAWGSLVHGLLEHAMRHERATRGELERLARWLTVEAPELREVVPEAIDVVEEVRCNPFWAEAQRARERHVEVPFAVRIDGSAVEGSGLEKPAVVDFGSRAIDPAQPRQRSLFESDDETTTPTDTLRTAASVAKSTAERDVTVLRGVIDLAYLAGDGWRIVDYKTDYVVDMRELVARHAPQVQGYREAWARGTAQQVTAAGLFSVRRVRIEWLA